MPRTFTANTPASPITPCDRVSRCTQISNTGGSAETAHTAVAVMPARSPAEVSEVTMQTPPARWRMPALKEAGSIVPPETACIQTHPAGVLPALLR
jgi:hypothetical protein